MICSNNFLEKLDNQDFETRINIDGFSIESSSTEVKLSFEGWIDENKLELLTKFILNSEIYQKCWHFSNFSTMGIVTQDTKPTIFQSSTLLHAERF